MTAPSAGRFVLLDFRGPPFTLARKTTWYAFRLDPAGFPREETLWK